MHYIVEKSYQASTGIAWAVLVNLGIGLLLQTIGSLSAIAWLTQIGLVTKTLFIPALGIGIALALKTKPMIAICAAATATIGGGGIVSIDKGSIGIAGGESVGAIVACLICIWVGNRLSGKTNFDIILTPAVCLLAGGVAGLLLSQVISPMLIWISRGITTLIEASPYLSSSIIGALFAMFILSPAAALAIALQLNPVASAAAIIGCSIQFTSFAFLSYKENTWGSFFAQLICTPKLQTPNIIKSPRIIFIPLLLSTILAPIGVLAFGITSSYEVAGLGLCALVSPLYLASHEGMLMLTNFNLITFAIPAVLTLLIRPFAYKWGLLKKDELRVNIN